MSIKNPQKVFLFYATQKSFINETFWRVLVPFRGNTSLIWLKRIGLFLLGAFSSPFGGIQFLSDNADDRTGNVNVLVPFRGNTVLMMKEQGIEFHECVLVPSRGNTVLIVRGSQGRSSGGVLVPSRGNTVLIIKIFCYNKYIRKFSSPLGVIQFLSLSLAASLFSRFYWLFAW